ncbi:hypothetical protein Tco_0705764 [Tanacetum coccineum]|uniref:Uncharacterized protein n=1 Tax=Tanacetum coccineum TaxID=301880 RepID=A0ABQ4Y723_9ASTR
MTVRDLTGSGFENTELYSRPKLQRSSNPTRSTNSGSQQSRVPSEGYTHHVCTTCRRRHQESVVVLLVLVSNAARHGQSSAGLQKNTGLSYLWHADNREGRQSKKPKTHQAVSLCLTRFRPPNTSRVVSFNALPLICVEYDDNSGYRLVSNTPCYD